MERQHGLPVYLPVNSERGYLLERESGFDEAQIQELIHQHPEVLPIAEIDPAFEGAVSICRELSTPAGYIDNFMITPTGLPVIVECKLWRNPQARREVVGQVLDYAKELSGWTSADVEREAARVGVRSVYDKVAQKNPDIDEAAFHDTLTRSLEQGRCLLLIVGDGIREGVEAIFEHLHIQGALQFSFGLVELPIYSLPGGARLASPRVLARTSVEVRRVVELPKGTVLEGAQDATTDTIDPETKALGDDRQAFWEQFLEALHLDDPEQPINRAPRQGFITFTLPVPGSTAWITCYRDVRKGDVGLFLSFSKNTIGQKAVDLFMETDCERSLAELGGDVSITERNGSKVLAESRHFGDLSDPQKRGASIGWLAARTNAFVNVLRPAIRSTVNEIERSEK